MTSRKVKKYNIYYDNTCKKGYLEQTLKNDKEILFEVPTLTGKPSYP